MQNNFPIFTNLQIFDRQAPKATRGWDWLSGCGARSAAAGQFTQNTHDGKV
jgi:hypothetical protein